MRSIKSIADRIVERIVPTVDAQAACLECRAGQTCVYKCCIRGSNVYMHRCCWQFDLSCSCEGLYTC